MEKNHYVKNKELLEEIIKFKDTGTVSERLGEMLLIIARNYASKGNYSGYTWVPDMTSEAVYTCIKYMGNFNPEKSTNAFAYITQICKRSFKAFIKKQKRHSYLKDVCYNSYNEIMRMNIFAPRSVDYEILIDKR